MVAMASRAFLRHLSRYSKGINAEINLKGFSTFSTSSTVRAQPLIQQISDGSSCQSIYFLRSDYAWRHSSARCFGGGSGIPYHANSCSQGVADGSSGPQGPGVFGDLTALSGVTDDMLDSMIALKDFGDVEGLPPLDVILEQDTERDRKAMRRELERKKQLELESKRVKTVDEFGRAYGTGRRKASTARVWIMEGEGKISINGKPHDLYFPDIDQRLQVLEPFWQTNQLGVFNVRATVKGGGVSGQSGAIRHGISKALQLFDPTLRPSLKSAGMLTRDSRVVERKKPGKAKARKSFQWVKR